MSVREFLCPDTHDYGYDQVDGCSTSDMAGTVIILGLAAIFTVVALALLVFLLGAIHDWVVDRYFAEDESITS